MRQQKSLRVVNFFVLISLSLFFSGCATSYVDSQWRPYLKLVDKSSSQLTNELSNIVSSLPENEYAALPGSNQVICRTADGYFLVPVGGTEIDITKALYLGSESSQAVNAAVYVRDSMQRQIEAGKAEMAMAAVAFMGAVQASQYNTYNGYQPPAPSALEIYSMTPPTPTKSAPSYAPPAPSPSYQAHVNNNGSVSVYGSDNSYRWGHLSDNGSVSIYGSGGSYHWGHVNDNGSVSVYGSDGSYYSGHLNSNGNATVYGTR